MQNSTKLDSEKAPPKPKARLDSLQALRAFASIIVVLSHTTDKFRDLYSGEFVGGFFANGWSGVDVFFVLSGFIIYYIHARDLGQRSKAIDFIKKRGVRIYPLFWATVLFKMLLQRFRDAGPKLTLKEGLVAATLWPVPSAKQVGRSWTLFHEMFFYIVFLVGILTSEAVFIGILGLWLVANLGLLFLPDTSDPLLSTIFSVRNVGFILGIGVAMMYKANRPILKKQNAAVLAILGTLGYVGLFLIRGVDIGNPWWVLGFGLVSAAAMQGLLALEKENAISFPKWLLFLGDASYSIYLTHTFAISLGFSLLKASRTAPPSQLLVFIVPIIGIAAGSFVYVAFERPILEFLRVKLIAPKPAQA